MKRVFILSFFLFAVVYSAFSQFDTAMSIKGWKLRNSGKYKKAIARFTYVIDKYKNDTSVYRTRGVEDEHVNFYLSDTHVARAECYWYLGESNKAIDDYKLALKISPNEFMIYDALGMIYLRLNDFVLAEEFLKKSMRDTTMQMPVSNLAGIYYLKKDYKTAERYLLKLTFKPYEEGSAVSIYYYNLACVYLNTNSYQKALEAINKSIEISYAASKKIFDSMYKRKPPSMTFIYVTKEKYLCKMEIDKALGLLDEAKKDKKLASKNPAMDYYSAQIFGFPIHN